MKLWVVGSARAASVPDEKEPHWTAFEKVHISLTPVEILAGQRAPSIGNEFISIPGRTACSRAACVEGRHGSDGRDRIRERPSFATPRTHQCQS